VSLARSCRGHDMGCLCNRLHRIRPLAVAGDCTTTCAALTPANHRYTTTIHGNNRRTADRGRVLDAHEAVAGTTVYVKRAALALLLNQRDALHLPRTCILSVPPSSLSCPRPHASQGSARGSQSTQFMQKKPAQSSTPAQPCVHGYKLGKFSLVEQRRLPRAAALPNQVLRDV
jgi:hypothetical protein